MPTGGKGNAGMFIERDPKICAAGVPTKQPGDNVSELLKYYPLKDEVDALISDALMPPKPSRPLPPLRHPIQPDMRHAYLTQVSEFINPPPKKKIEIMGEELKNTMYSSFWNKPLGKCKDPVPMLPEGFDIEGTTFGKKTNYHESLYDVIMPKVPLPDNTPLAKRVAAQTDRNYCRPAFTPELTYGHRTGIDKRGRYAKCCVTDDTVKIGLGGRDVVNSVLADFQAIKKPRLAESLFPCGDIKLAEVCHLRKLRSPSVPELLTDCPVNPEKEHFRKCYSHLNKLRKMLFKLHSAAFFSDLYLGLKYRDKQRTGWLPKETVYEYCNSKFVRFDPSLVEPVLTMWKAFDGKQIEYKTLVDGINYRVPPRELPKLHDFPDECLDYRTTYSEMVKPNQPPDCSPMAGLPSGRYFDLDWPKCPENYVKAVLTCLPDETDMKACLNPTVMTLHHVNHRDLYEKREPEVIRRVFEKMGETFTDERFEEVWKEAKKLHSEGWVCFETFRRALEMKQDSDGN